ncbi:MAG: tetratricopeptide repeat protein [Candidatus Omnitrophica bacterium]|nr:tetratricopeptide repeat protein [Candidatus Omnitrophota bacterium]
MNKLLSILVLALCVSGCGSPKDKARVSEKKASYVQVASALLAEQKVKEAALVLNQGIKAEPQNPENYILLGEIYMRIGDFEQALGVLTVAEKISPDNPGVYYMMAMNYGFNKDFQNGISAAKKSAELFLKKDDQERFQKAAALVKVFTEQAQMLSGTVPAAQAMPAMPAVPVVSTDTTTK